LLIISPGPEADVVNGSDETPTPGTEVPVEAELVAGCRQGKLASFEWLYRLHGARMKSIAFNMLGDRSDAEDAVQEAFLKVYRKISEFRGESGLATWIYRILLNTCYDLRRRRARVRAATADPVVPLEDLGEASAAHHSTPLRFALESAILRLNPRHRSIFVLYEVEGFSHSEIGRILQIPEGTSKHGLYQAKRELQRLLGRVRYRRTP
jgi:RNA polymerase sigma-70 factor (ECF subfamily)